MTVFDEAETFLKEDEDMQISFYGYVTQDEVNRFAIALLEAREVMKAIQLCYEVPEESTEWLEKWDKE